VIFKHLHIDTERISGRPLEPPSVSGNGGK
jgi:hypothetical protein